MTRQIIYIIQPIANEYSTEKDGIETGRDTLVRSVFPRTEFDAINHDRAGKPPAPLGSTTGQEYIEDALSRTQRVVEKALERLHNVFVEDTASEPPVWDTILNDMTLQYTAHKIAQSRGPATYLYNHHGAGLRTPDQVEEYLQYEGSSFAHEPCDGEYLLVIPYSVHY